LRRPRLDGRPRDRRVSIPFWVSTALRRYPPTQRHFRGSVSIPFWVSTALRPPRPASIPARTSCFNPVLGFYRVATNRSSIARMLVDLFQSRSGFLPRCDRVRSAARDTSPCFNPVLGFYRVATRRTRRRQAETRSVSIPFWVSTALRRDVADRGDAMTSTFQSRSGFLPRCDSRPNFRGRGRAGCFNPVLGFYRVATVVAPDGRKMGVRVSIPFWVSTALRPTSSVVSLSFPTCFNPVLGFYRVATAPPLYVSDVSPLRFNPVLGFYRVATADTESIAVWDAEFQSRSGFLPRCDERKLAFVDDALKFQSRSGFLPRCDSITDGPEDISTGVFQSRSGFLPRCDTSLS